MIGVKVSTRDWRPAEISHSHHRYFRKPESHSHVEDRIDDDDEDGDDKQRTEIFPLL